MNQKQTKIALVGFLGLGALVGQLLGSPFGVPLMLLFGFVLAFMPGRERPEK